MGIKQEAKQESTQQGTPQAPVIWLSAEPEIMVKIPSNKETGMNVPKKDLRKIIIEKLK